MKNSCLFGIGWEYTIIYNNNFLYIRMYTRFIHCILGWYGIEDYQKDRIVVLKEHHTEEMQTT